MNKVKLSMKRIRLESNLSQGEFAKACHVSVDTVKEWEANFKMPDSNTLQMIERLILSIRDR